MAELCPENRAEYGHPCGEKEMNEIEQYRGTAALNDETAEWLNGQYTRMERGTRLLLDIALGIGEVLRKLENSHAGNFQSWMSSLQIPKTTAYRYVTLYEYRNQIAAANNLTEAYRQIETLEAQKKQSETRRACQRAAEYRRTGKKPEGWRQHTDDKLAKEAAERDARIGAVNQEALEREQTAREERREETKRPAEEADRETEMTAGLFSITAGEGRKRMETKHCGRQAMREIEFRGKRANGDEWVYGFLDHTYDRYTIHSHGAHYCYEVHPETVGQYTGLKDRNGVKIFEGDIVKSDSTDMAGDVYWIKEHASFYWGTGQSLIHYDELEVIGNIHDNPELPEGR